VQYSLVGSPPLYEFALPSEGNPQLHSNPLPLRYLYEVMLLEKAFKGNAITDGFKGFDVIEIGGGFGGMLSTFAHIYDLNSYRIVDLPCVHELTKKVLLAGNDTRAAAVFIPLTPTNAEVVKSDLLISFWSISEQKSATVDKYIEAYIAHATRGYLQLNYDDDVANGGICFEKGNNKDRDSVLALFSKIYKVQPSAVLLPPAPCGVTSIWGNHHLRIKWGPDLPFKAKADPITGLEPIW
jgi:hypothetical protein